jgi:hypothetical protein
LLLTLPQQPEPTRSILLRSAAALARDAGQFQEALRLIEIGLAGKPSNEIAEELGQLLDDVRAELGNGTFDQPASGALLEAKRFTEAVGGMEQARRSLEALGRLG